MKSILVFCILFNYSYGILYDSYHGTLISKQDLERYKKSNITLWCTRDVAPCDPDERRRIDGTCTKLDDPIKGSAHTRLVRVLPASFDKDFEPRKAVSGNNLPLARHLRTRLLAEGRVSSQKFTQLATHFLVFMSGDVLSQHDTINYILWKPYCCAPHGKTDYACVPNKIRDDDPVHRFSNIRCLNMTRPETYQSIGCMAKETAPERIVSNTPLLDLSVIYGTSENDLLRYRTLQGGLLKHEIENRKIWPPSTKTKPNVCLLNDIQETRCHDTPNEGTNTIAGINLFAIWFWRLHNLIAKDLAEVNRCWNDQKLFDNARDISIATALQIYYYEIMPLLLGRENMERDGVITPTLGFRDIYNPTISPQLSLEYSYVLRWLHTMQEGSLKMYDTNGAYMKQIPIVNLTLKTGYYGVDDNMVYMTQGSFRQGAADTDYVVDPDIAEIGLGPHQRASDITTNDLAKGRYFGLQSFIKYREFCFGKPIKSWHDLNNIIDPERIESLKDNYKNVEDIDLLAGIWLESHIYGGSVPSTFYCLVIDQLLRNIVSDRHWYERPDRPYAFTFPQLLQFRKRTIASVLCEVGDGVSEIQPEAFLRIGPNNKIVECNQFSKFDYSMWKDPACGRPVYWNTNG